MYSFVLYCIKHSDNILEVDNKEKWVSKEGFPVAFTQKPLERKSRELVGRSSRQNLTLYAEVEIQPSQRQVRYPTGTIRIFIRPSSNLMLVDIKNNFELSLIVVSELCDRFGLEAEHLLPADDRWISLFEEGELLEALIATSHGLEDISQHEKFAWDWLRRNRLISATISLEHEGRFEIGFGQGQLIVNTNRIDQLKYVFRLVEEHLLRGNNFIESKPAC